MHILQDYFLNLTYKIQSASCLKTHQTCFITHQILIAEPSELLKLLRYEELSAAYSTADCPQHYKHKQM